MPPAPCTTRWGTWLKAAVYYCDNFEDVKKVVSTFDESDAESIRLSKEMFQSARIKTDLAFIKANFASIVTGITKLQTQGMFLADGLLQVESIHKSLNELNRKEFAQKMDAVLSRNKGYKSIVEIRNILKDGADPKDDYARKLTAKELTMFMYCPVTSVDVERSFSVYSSFLTPNRRTFLFENLKQHMIIHCNRNESDSD